MSKIKQKLYRKIVNVSENQQEMLRVFVEKWGFISEAEVIRQALVFFYKKWEPEYLQPGFKEKDRQEQQKVIRRIQDMSDEEYAIDVVKGRVMSNSEGKRYVVTFGMSNSVYVTPLEQIKPWSQQDDGWFMKYNLQMVSSGAELNDRILLVQDMLRNSYKIDIPPTSYQNTSLLQESSKPVTEFDFSKFDSLSSAGETSDTNGNTN